jgi:hypothetical protein
MDENNKPQEKLTEREKELIEKIANLEQDKTNLVGEIQETRAQKIVREKEIADLKKSLETEGKESDPEALVERVLSKRAQESADSNFEKAKLAFKEQVKEFSKDVDQAGILFSKFEKEMSKFNFSGLSTHEDFLGRLKEVYEFTNRGKTQDNKLEYYKGSPANLGTDPHSNDGASLTAAESKLIKDLNWSKEQFMKVKVKRPTYVAQLLKYRSS